MLNKIIAVSLIFFVVIVFVLPILSWKIQSNQIDKKRKKKSQEEAERITRFSKTDFAVGKLRPLDKNYKASGEE